MQLLFIGDFLNDTFSGIIMVLDTIIFGLINSAYKIFMAISSARLLSSDVYYDIASRIYIVVGVVMLFVLSYAILKAIVDPDQASKGELGPQTVKRVIIAVVGLAITPVLFNVLYQGQGLLLEQDILGKIFFRIDNTEEVQTLNGTVNPDTEIKNIGGSVAAVSIWQAFFHPADGKDASQITADPSEYQAHMANTAALCLAAIGVGVITAFFTLGTGLLIAGASLAACAVTMDAQSDTYSEMMEATNGEEVSLEQAYAIAAADGNFDIFLIFHDNYAEDGTIYYLWFISTVCGAFCLYAFASFSIDMGVRAAKLAYYQIIAPVPLIMQVLPKYKDTFSKYIKNVVSTFLEVFIRISVVYIVVYVICHLQDLFSSFGSLWGNQSLSTPERALALAFLILGLVIFAKSAPDIICQSLNIEKGSMKLGLGKKIAEGGGFAAAGTIGAGYTGIRRNWRSAMDKAKEGGKDPRIRDYASAAMSAIAGGASASARSAYNQFGPGPDRKPAMNFRDAANVAERAAQAATDARDARDERQGAFGAAQEAYRKANQAYIDAYESGVTGEPLRKLAEAREAALANVIANSSALGAKIDDIAKKREAWVVGTVSTAREEAAMKFGADLDALKGKLREEAYKKDGTARSLYDSYNAKKSEVISEYAEGYDEQTANAEFRERRRKAASIANYDAMESDFKSAKSSFDALVADGKKAGDREYDEALRRLTDAKTALNAGLAAAGVGVSIGDDNVLDMWRGIKKSEAEMQAARRARDNEAEGLRMAMEAAADDFVRRKAMDESSNTYRDISTFLSEHASYMSQNQNMDIVVDLGTGRKEKLGDVITRTFGDGALDGKFTLSDDFKVQFGSQNSVKLELSKPIKIGSSEFTDVTYKMETVKDADGKDVQMYVPYGVSKDGTVGGKITGSEKFKPVKTESFFDVIAEKIASGSVSKATSETAVSKASDIGKTAATYIRNHDYAEKVSRKRQAEDAKGGGKK